MVHLLTAIERYLRQHLDSDLERQRFERAKGLVDEAAWSAGAIAHRTATAEPVSGMHTGVA